MLMTSTRYMLLSAAAFAVMGSLVKLAGTWHIPLLQIIFVRALVSVVLSLVDIARVTGSSLGQSARPSFGQRPLGILSTNRGLLRDPTPPLCAGHGSSISPPGFHRFARILVLGRATYERDPSLYCVEPAWARPHGLTLLLRRARACLHRRFTNRRDLRRTWRRTG